jgi:hypothetical protein
MFKVFRFTTYMAFLTCLAFSVQAEMRHGVIQFISDGFSANEETAYWKDISGKFTCHTVHPATNGWSLAQRFSE